jgi:alpha-L-fucosidase
MGDFDGPEQRIGRFQINRPWETCATIGGPWGWGGDADPITYQQAINLIVRCAGNGGNLALNTGPSPDGAINPKHAARYREMGAWLKKYGESFYATEGGPYMPGPWGVCTHKTNRVYLHLLGEWNGGTMRFPSLPVKIVNARLLTGGSVGFEQDIDGVKITIGKEDLDPVNTVVELCLEKDEEIPMRPVRTIGDSLTLNAGVTASSNSDIAQNIVADNVKEFTEGIYVKTPWSMGAKDKEPWLMLDLRKTQTFNLVGVKEGHKFSSAGKVSSFIIEASDNGKDWRVVHKGTTIGGLYGLVLNEPVKASKVRIRFLKYTERISINAVNLFMMQ